MSLQNFGEVSFLLQICGPLGHFFFLFNIYTNFLICFHLFELLVSLGMFSQVTSFNALVKLIRIRLCGQIKDR